MQTKIIIYLLSGLMFSSCNDNVDNALKMADDNYEELVKVLDYFKNDPDPLKYESAKFLVTNMPYHYTLDNHIFFDSVFKETIKEPLSLRTKYYNSHKSWLNNTSVNRVYDIRHLKANYLIETINSACNTWEHSKWYKQYNDSLFLNYVLPYRIGHEAISDWTESINKGFPLLSNPIVLSRRGIQYEAENAQYHKGEIIHANGASLSKMVLLTAPQSSISFKITSERKTFKRLILKYTTTERNFRVSLFVNGQFVDSLFLKPTNNLQTFCEKWFNISIPLKCGCNSIDICSPTDTLGVDYIQLGAIEQFADNDLIDFSSHTYSIYNKNTHNYIEFPSNKEDYGIELHPYNKSNNLQKVSLTYRGFPLWEIGNPINDPAMNCFEIPFGTKETLKPHAAVAIGTYENRPFQQWIFFPVGNNFYMIMNKHTGMFLESRIDSITKKELLVQSPYSSNDSQKWKLLKSEKKESDKFYEIDSSISEALRVFDITHQFEFFLYTGNNACDGETLIKEKTGKCVDEANYTVFLCRYLGIPATVDFTPNWGNRQNGHSWSVIVCPDGKSTPFYMGNVPGDTAHYYHPYKKPKVYRQMFQLNKTIADDLKEETEIPQLFEDPTFTDVTSEYCLTSDIIRMVPTKFQERKIAYLFVFDNTEWVPVCYGRVNDSKVVFPSVSRGIMFLSGFFENGHVVPFGCPFYLDNNGETIDVSVDENQKQTLKLSRKYPFMGAEDYFNFRMSGGKFQGANKKDFSDSITLYTHNGMTNGNWYHIHIDNPNKFKYLRYIGPKGSYCNINELKFYSEEGLELKGKIIGTEGETGAKKETVFDGNILTGFYADSPDGNWVGLELSKAQKVSEIQYIPRNDGNCIEIGDTYALYYWKKNRWEELGRQVAEDNMLSFGGVPTGGLYILSNLTKGSEERIFTYGNEKQVWW